MKKQYLEAGKIVTTHGIKGEIKIMPYTDYPELLCEFDRLFLGKNHEEINVERSRDDLELDEDTYFIQDLIGIEVSDADSGFVYGKITDVMQTGANDVYVVQGKDREYLVPAIPEVVITTDIDENTMTIRPLEGLFE